MSLALTTKTRDKEKKVENLENCGEILRSEDGDISCIFVRAFGGGRKRR